MLSQVPLRKRELSLRTQAEATEEGSRHDRLKTDAETRALYRKEEQIQGLSEPKIETGEMKSRMNKITDERNGPWGPPLHPCCRWKTEGQRKQCSASYGCAHHSSKHHRFRFSLISRAFLLSLGPRAEQHK